MQVVRHTDPEAFIAAAAPMMARGEASASFFTAVAYRMKNSPLPADERVYLAAFGDIGVAVRRDDGPVVIGQSDPRAAAAFARDLAPDWPELQGVVGALDASEAFARQWRDLTGRRHVLRIHMRQHALSAIAEVPSAPGAMRVAGEGDHDWLLDAQFAFVAEIGVPDTPERIRSTLPTRLARGEIRIWDDGGPVAFAGFSDAAPDFARIAPVYTPPDRRRCGYATALVASMSRELLSRGKRRLFLATDVANPTSNAIYARIGFVPESDDYHFDLVDAVS
jgi:predicted GNAT family acetyltransferase